MAQFGTFGRAIDPSFGFVNFQRLPAILASQSYFNGVRFIFHRTEIPIDDCFSCDILYHRPRKFFFLRFKGPPASLEKHAKQGRHSELMVPVACKVTGIKY
jgi:hypothetical protein